FNLGSELMVGHKVGLSTDAETPSDGLHRRHTDNRMHQDIGAHFRLLAVAYFRYLEAERSLRTALDEAHGYFPIGTAPHPGTLGAPGSYVRRQRESRDQALLRLQSCHAKYRAAKARLARRQAMRREIRLLSVRF
ncbi:hypothetical protein, partial [Lutimaribacter pacificus]